MQGPLQSKRRQLGDSLEKEVLAFKIVCRDHSNLRDAGFQNYTQGPLIKKQIVLRKKKDNFEQVD